MTIFAGGALGSWRVLSIEALRGESLEPATHLAIYDEAHGANGREEGGEKWLLRGVRSHVRYVERREKGRLDELSPPLGRPQATRAALVPIRKTAAWWDLPQDERRAIFEERSRHIANSMKYMSAIARRLYHARDLGEPFDFLTWFEFAPEDAPRFDELLAMLRATEEWTYVEREVDVRLSSE